MEYIIAIVKMYPVGPKAGNNLMITALFTFLNWRGFVYILRRTQLCRARVYATWVRQETTDCVQRNYVQTLIYSIG